MKTAKGDIAYSVAGEGPALVLLHPIGMDRGWWAPYVAHWRARHRVIAIDLPGHGESAPVRSPVSLEDHARAVLEVIDAEGVASAVLMGVSMGGMVAQCVAIAAPDRVRALVLCATAGRFPASARAAIRSRGDSTRDGAMSEVIAPTLARWFVADSPPEIVERCRARLASDDWHSWSANWEAISELDTLEGLRALDVPTLVVASARDASIPDAVARELAEASRAEFVRIEDSGHFGAFDAPHRFTPVVDAFLQEKGG